VGAEPGLLARNLVRDWAPDLIRGGSWTRAFCSADAAVAAVLAALLDRDEALLEPRAAWELAAALPPGALLYASSSMPVRDLDAFLPRRAEPLRVLCNRGANGIDGVLSSALGAAASGVAPVVLLIGDIALLHDIGALLAARRYRPDLTMLVLNNDGGGIFAALPVAGAGADGDYDEFFRLPHGLTFAAAAALYGIEYHAVRSWADYRAGLAGVVRGAGPRLLELVIDADANRAHVAALMQAGAAAVAGAA
jgi:2-succinyl-5-enolpyruvyl-6-hydroxy-3-cyclohexene-1-carboxylate synthase